MLLWEKLIWLFKLTLPTFVYFIYPHLCFFCQNIVMNELEMFPPLHAMPNCALKVCKWSPLNFEWHNMTRQRTPIPSQATTIFLSITSTLLKLPITTIWKCLWSMFHPSPTSQCHDPQWSGSNSHVTHYQHPYLPIHVFIVLLESEQECTSLEP